MKKVFKSRIFAFVLGAIIFSGITSVAAYTIFANDIGYTPKDSTWKKSNGEDITNVKDAIDELYTKANIFNIESASSTYSAGIAIPDRYVTKNLSKGKYVVSIAFGLGTTWSGGTNTFNEVELKPTCSNESDCLIQKLKVVSIVQKSNSNNSYLNIIHGMYYVQVLSDNTILNYNNHYGETYDTHSTILNMEVSKIN